MEETGKELLEAKIVWIGTYGKTRNSLNLWKRLGMFQLFSIVPSYSLKFDALHIFLLIIQLIPFLVSS